jgi:prepilin-type processing-associated H-X9-DG protein
MIGEMHGDKKLARATYWAYTYTSYAASTVVPESGTLMVDYNECLASASDTSICNRGWGSFHPRGVNFLLCDGSVQFVSLDVNMNILAEMATIDGGNNNPTDLP